MMNSVSTDVFLWACLITSVPRSLDETLVAVAWMTMFELILVRERCLNCFSALELPEFFFFAIAGCTSRLGI